jgi:hypothetical protein
MVFWIFVEKNKKTVFEANGRYKHKKTQTKNAQKAKSQAKNQVLLEEKWFFVNPAPTPSTTWSRR